MSSGNEAVIEQLVGNLRRLVKAVYLDSSKISRQYGLTSAQSAVLRILFKKGSLSSAEMSRRLYVTPSNITGIIDRLEKKGLVERVRQASDRRVALIQLTPGGAELSRKIPDPIEKKLITQLSGLKKDQVRSLAVAMDQIVNLIDTPDVGNGPLELNPPQKP